MIKDLAWSTFKNTGNINTFLEFMELKNTEKNIEMEINKSLQINENSMNNNINEK